MRHVQTYLQPLRARELVDEEQLNHMFSNIEQLWSISHELLAALEARLQEWSPQQRLGDIFLRLVPSLQVYDEYYNNYDRAVETVDKLERQDAGFKQFLRNLEVQVGGVGCEALTLSSRLIMPIQRLPRYLMLLSALADKTDVDHADLPLLREALEQLQEIATRIDDQLKRMENRNRIYCIQSQLHSCPVLATPNRFLLKEGVVLKMASSFAVNCTIYLFSDVLVYAHRSLKSFSLLRYKGTISLATCFVYSIPDSDEMKNAFQMLGAFEKPLTLYTKRPEDKEAWIAAIEDAIEALLLTEPDLIDQRKSWKPSKKTQGVWRLLRERNLLKRVPDHVDSRPLLSARYSVTVEEDGIVAPSPSSTSSLSSSLSSLPPLSASFAPTPTLPACTLFHSAPMMSVQEVSKDAHDDEDDERRQHPKAKSVRLRKRSENALFSGGEISVSSRHSPPSAESTTSSTATSTSSRKEKRRDKEKETKRKHLLNSLTLRKFTLSSLHGSGGNSSARTLSPPTSPHERPSLAQLLSPRLPPLARRGTAAQSTTPRTQSPRTHDRILHGSTASAVRRETSVSQLPPPGDQSVTKAHRGGGRSKEGSDDELLLIRSDSSCEVYHRPPASAQFSSVIPRPTSPPLPAAVSSTSPCPSPRSCPMGGSASVAKDLLACREWEPVRERPKVRPPPPASGSPHPRRRHQRQHSDDNHLP